MTKQKEKDNKEELRGYLRRKKEEDGDFPIVKDSRKKIGRRGGTVTRRHHGLPFTPTTQVRNVGRNVLD